MNVSSFYQSRVFKSGNKRDTFFNVNAKEKKQNAAVK